MCKIIDKTCLSPTPTLEQHLMWDDIAILARYMLMLSFNNSLDVAAHLPYLFHVVTFLVATGPLSLRASTHGLVINIIHSLCTCSQLHFSGKFWESNSCVTRSFVHFASPDRTDDLIIYYDAFTPSCLFKPIVWHEILSKRKRMSYFLTISSHSKETVCNVCLVDSSSYHINLRTQDQLKVLLC